MKTNFVFKNLLGTVYRSGNLLFTPDGTCLLSPVGNRITVFDLLHNTSHTLPFAHRCNISCIALNPHGNLLLSVDEDGKAILANMPRRLALHHFSFNGPLSALAFSPSGRHFLVAVGRIIEVWHTPDIAATTAEGLAFTPFVQHRLYAGHRDHVSHLTWSKDSRFFLSSSNDLTTRIWSLTREEGFSPTVLAGHRENAVGAWFSTDQENIYTISQDGALFVWRYTSDPRLPDDDPEALADDRRHQWRISQRHYFHQQHAKIKCATFHAKSNLIVAGFSNGLFCLYELPDFVMIHTLSISKSNLDVVALNNSAEWLAFGSSHLGQLLVWEWQSESYILKQQGHFDSITDVTYSPDGQRIITTAEDGKIKLWDARSGFCVVTFTEHSSSVTACKFASKGLVLFTSSLDGSVRAWDLIRYRNFRTFSAPTRLCFSCVAVDPSNEVVCAGSTESFGIYIWSVQTGQLLDQLAGHEGPVTSLAFAPSGDQLVSGSWDHTVRIWSIFNRTQTSESLLLQADVLAVAFRPDSRQIAVSTLDGQLTFWSIAEAAQSVGLDSRRDLAGGRNISDRRTAANTAGTRSMKCVSYSINGFCVIAGGKSKYICLYDIKSGVLLKKFTVSVNLSLQGTQEFLNSRDLTEAGPRMVYGRGEASDLEDRTQKAVRSATQGDASLRHIQTEVAVTGLAFSPLGTGFCVASTEGLLIYSTDSGLEFDPFDLDIETTPSAITQAVKAGDYLRALVRAFRLNEPSLIRQVFESTATNSIPLIAKEIPRIYLSRLIRFLARIADEDTSFDFGLSWIEGVLSAHGAWLKSSAANVVSELRTLQKSLAGVQIELTPAAVNMYTLEYMLCNSRREVSDGFLSGGLVGTNGNTHMQMLTGPEGMDTEWDGLDDD